MFHNQAKTYMAKAYTPLKYAYFTQIVGTTLSFSYIGLQEARDIPSALEKGFVFTMITFWGFCAGITCIPTIGLIISALPDKK